MNQRRHLGPITRPTELANWVMMGNNQKGKSTLMVEGTSDSNVFLLMIDSSKCRMIISEGKDNVLAAMEIIRRRTYPGVLAIVDADFDHLENRAWNLNDVAVTDTHDIETMMLSTSAFQKVLFRYGVGTFAKVQIDAEAFEKSAEELLNRLLSAGMRLGYLRWASKRHDLRIGFDQIDYSRVVDASTLILREDRLEIEVLRASGSEAGTWMDINSRATSLMRDTHDPWQICNGHDLTKLLALYLTRVTRLSVTRKAIEADLSLAYSSDHLRATKLYGTVIRWEQGNAPKQILKSSI